MKIVFSRKGFDSQYGGMPSPIFPDGRIVPLPIPSSHDRHTFGNINIPDIDLAAVLSDLSQGAHHIDATVHLDPDLDRSANMRLPDWRPALGQTGAAQSHLASMNVGAGDVFLFFGWFRQIERTSGIWRYVKGAPHLHVIFGWLEIFEVIPVVTERNQCLKKYPWLADHPHVANPGHYESSLNNLYIATSTSRFAKHARFGGGRFRQYSDDLLLTMPGSTRSVWALPHWIAPAENKRPLSYHHNPQRWQVEKNHVRLQSVAKGQEFVLDGEFYPELESWIMNLVGNNA